MHLSFFLFLVHVYYVPLPAVYTNRIHSTLFHISSHKCHIPSATYQNSVESVYFKSIQRIWMGKLTWKTRLCVFCKLTILFSYHILQVGYYVIGKVSITHGIAHLPHPWLPTLTLQWIVRMPNKTVRGAAAFVPPAPSACVNCIYPNLQVKKWW